MLYCGWDGGGTKTEICLTEAGGALLCSEVFGPLNPNGATRDKVAETVRGGVAWMTEKAGGHENIAGVVVGMAGINNRSAKELVEGSIRAAGWTGPLLLTGDQDIALAGAVEGPGMLLVAGTGSICCGKDPEGRSFRTGGYGHLIDDGGSGWAIGRDILTALVRAFDGRGAETCLTDLVYDRLGFRDLDSLITWLYAPETGKRGVASLASLLPEALKQGDEAALAIARRAAEELSALVEAGWNRSGLREGEIAFTGSILTKMPAVRSLVEGRLKITCPGLTPVSPRLNPARGAAKMAEELYGAGS